MLSLLHLAQKAAIPWHWSKSIRIRPFWLLPYQEGICLYKKSAGKPTGLSADASGLSADVKYEISATQ